MLARWPLVCYDTKGYFDDVKICHVTINTHTDVKAGAKDACWLLWRMKYAEDFNQWR